MFAEEIETKAKKGYTDTSVKGLNPGVNSQVG